MRNIESGDGDAGAEKHSGKDQTDHANRYPKT
jgi:hypothetical protein